MVSTLYNESSIRKAIFNDSSVSPTREDDSSDDYEYLPLRKPIQSLNSITKTNIKISHSTNKTPKTKSNIYEKSPLLAS